MIQQWENGTRVIELGKGTTQIGQVLVDGNTMSSGIFFSNQKPVDGKMDNETVVIQITTINGAMSYMRAVVELLKTWEIKGAEKQLEELNQTINQLLEKK